MAERKGTVARHTYKDLSSFSIRLRLEFSNGDLETAHLCSEDLEHLLRLGITASRRIMTSSKKGSSGSTIVEELGPTSLRSKDSSMKEPRQKKLRISTGAPGSTTTGRLIVIDPSKEGPVHDRWFSGLKERLVQANLLLSTTQQDLAPTGECQEVSGSKDTTRMQQSSSTTPMCQTSPPDSGSDSSIASPFRLSSKEVPPGFKQLASGSQALKAPRLSSTVSSTTGNSSDGGSPTGFDATNYLAAQEAIQSSQDEEEGQSTCWSEYERDAEEFFKTQQVKRMSDKEIEIETEIGKWNDLDDFYTQDTLRVDDD